MNKHAYKFLEVAAAHETNHPALSWAHLDKIDKKPVIMTSDGYRLHVVWTDTAQMGKRFPFAFSGDYDTAENHVSYLKALDGVTQDIRYLVTADRLLPLLKALQRTRRSVYVAHLISHQNGLYLGHENGLSFLAFTGIDVPNGALTINVQFAIDALIHKRRAVYVGWNTQQTDKPKPYLIGEEGIAAAYIAPMGGTAIPKDYSRYIKLAEAMAKGGWT